MKLRWWNSIFAVLITSSSIAQIEFQGGISFGAITSQVHGDGYQGFNKIGLSGGPYVKMEFSETSAVRIDILYAQKGSSNNPDTEAGDFNTFKLKLDYIEIPILYSWAFREHISFDIGPYAALLINSSQISNGNDFDINPPYNDWDIGASAGVTYNISYHWNAVLRYSSSILPMRDAPDSAQQTATWNAGGYNYALALLLGYRF